MTSSIFNLLVAEFSKLRKFNLGLMVEQLTPGLMFEGFNLTLLCTLKEQKNFELQLIYLPIIKNIVYNFEL
jgi:hypothetical protein